jgi:hypothetical protein
MSRRRRPRKLTAYEEQCQMAAAGDVAGLWHILRTSKWSMSDHGELFRLLLQAIEVASSRDPATFAADVLARLVGLGTYLALRAQYAVLHAVDRADQPRGVAPAGLPAELERLLPRLYEIQGHLAELLVAQASAARLWELTLAKRTANEAAARKILPAGTAAIHTPLMRLGHGDSAAGVPVLNGARVNGAMPEAN